MSRLRAKIYSHVKSFEDLTELKISKAVVGPDGYQQLINLTIRAMVEAGRSVARVVVLSSE